MLEVRYTMAVVTAPSRAGFLCVDCGVCTACAREYYMVRDELWKEHGAGDGMLCVGCLEKRMGRRLVGTDFASLFQNPEFCSRRLLRRLRSPAQMELLARPRRRAP